MRRVALLITALTAVIVLGMPFVGGSGQSLVAASAAHADLTGDPEFASTATVAASTDTASATVVDRQTDAQVAAATAEDLKTDTEHVAQKPVPQPVPVAAATTQGRRAAAAVAGVACPGNVGGGTAGAPGRVAGGGSITGTTSGDVAQFAAAYNSVRVANCLNPVPMANFRYDSCMEDRLIWMAEDPSTDPSSAWGHSGSTRSDGVPSYGCDGNLAGGSGNTGATVAQKWWDSTAHRNSLYRPSNNGSTAGVCIYFAMTHGGVPDEPASFTRAAARWGGC